MVNKFCIAIVDYDMGNVKSIENAIKQISNYDVVITSNAKEIEQADCIILPGVGAFPDAMKKLLERNLIDTLNKAVVTNKKPTLGICLGMQLLFESSVEVAETKGLGWIPGQVKQMVLPQGLRVPHVGWNALNLARESEFFNHLTTDKDFYFVHSFHADCEDIYKIATFEYGHKMTAAVQNDNVVGMQFHPEKSQKIGLETLNNFFEWAKSYYSEVRLYA